jgi:hypothetical protein
MSRLGPHPHTEGTSTVKFSRVTQTPQPDRTDGLSAITFYGSWIVNADTKSGFLSAG